ncbi:hypothetical protein BDV27DRAFT_144298 [Aspergillus caelatus]|uniref:Protein kinase domain-containing protein n=1 Tax=Aspergillus caelatus TaxID=61420 RepID=A0A5N7AAN0_9EURO|nr:uncharacterized protein BDV27DRAFT_144298 [Aspergillus caelatus]KAE8365640.1 hypothetical protein BDV27DRAFT_144298 [Aspergillus caelatus]
MLQRMKKFAEAASHPGLCFTRLASDIFELHTSFGRHCCILSPNAMLPKLLVRSLMHRLFFAINWLHATCNLIHTGLVRIQKVDVHKLGGIPMLTDFGQLREDDGRINQDWITPDSYRAPEVLLQIPWTFQVDMWSVGVMVSDSCEKSHLLF